VYTDICDFDRQASDPTASLLALKVLRSEIRAILFQEDNEAEEIAMKLDERLYIFRGIRERLTEALESLEVSDGREHLSSGNHAGGEPVEEGVIGNVKPEMGEPMGGEGD
jgi:hypothetical protein